MNIHFLHFVADALQTCKADTGASFKTLDAAYGPLRKLSDHVEQWPELFDMESPYITFAAFLEWQARDATPERAALIRRVRGNLLKLAR